VSSNRETGEGGSRCREEGEGRKVSHTAAALISALVSATCDTDVRLAYGAFAVRDRVALSHIKLSVSN
jgi:hypothetical protein